MPLVRINNKLVYFAHIPRCAGSAVENYLAKRFGPLAFLDRRYFLTPQEDRWSQTSPQHIDATTLKQIIPKTFIDASFCVVRHPSTRLRSVFLRHRDIEGTIPHETDFEEWCTQLPLPGFALDNHTRPMVDFIPPDCKVFRIEDGFDPLVDWIDAIAGDTDDTCEITITNSHDQKLALQDHIGGEIPRMSFETTSLLAKIYSDDMILGDYVINQDTNLNPLEK